jgi:NADH-quinone oxidoreductase subunit C
MNLETIKSDLEAAIPGCRVEIILNPSSSAQHSLLVDAERGRSIAAFLRDAPHLKFDFCSNVTGIDWPAKETSTKVKVTRTIDGVENQVDEIQKTSSPGYLEVVYHLYSHQLKHGPLPLRLRTQDREAAVHLPSLTPIWRSADFQEREIFDLYGVIFDGHPDLRRLLMWDEFVDHPMRRDYVDPDDYEYEPTAHDEVLAHANQHASKEEVR